MKLANGKDVEVMQSCVLETEEKVFIVCKDGCKYRLLDMDDGNLLKEVYDKIEDMDLDYKFRRIVYDGVVEPDEGRFIDVDLEEE